MIFMKEVFFYVVSWLFSTSLIVSDYAKITSTTCFSKSHIKPSVTAQTPVRLKEIDALNPLFILK